jgi:hypothetical protein
MKHTPGPWVVNKQHKTISYKGCFDVATADNEYLIAQTIGGLGEQEEANARLIAAAPDLLEALKQLASVAIGTEHGKQFEYQIDLAIAAIAKATGETQ